MATAGRRVPFLDPAMAGRLDDDQIVMWKDVDPDEVVDAEIVDDDALAHAWQTNAWAIAGSFAVPPALIGLDEDDLPASPPGRYVRHLPQPAGQPGSRTAARSRYEPDVEVEDMMRARARAQAAQPGVTAQGRTDSPYALAVLRARQARRDDPTWQLDEDDPLAPSELPEAPETAFVPPLHEDDPGDALLTAATQLSAAVQAAFAALPDLIGQVAQKMQSALAVASRSISVSHYARMAAWAGHLRPITVVGAGRDDPALLAYERQEMATLLRICAAAHGQTVPDLWRRLCWAMGCPAEDMRSRRERRARRPANPAQDCPVHGPTVGGLCRRCARGRPSVPFKHR